MHVKKRQEELIAPRKYRIPDREPLLAALKKVSRDKAMEEHFYPTLLALAGQAVELHLVVRALLQGRHRYLTMMKRMDSGGLPNESILVVMLNDPNVAKEAITDVAAGWQAAKDAKDRRRASA